MKERRAATLVLQRGQCGKKGNNVDREFLPLLSFWHKRKYEKEIAKQMRNIKQSFLENTWEKIITMMKQIKWSGIKWKNLFKGDNSVISADFGNGLRLVGMTYSLASSQKKGGKRKLGERDGVSHEGDRVKYGRAQSDWLISERLEKWDIHK